MQVNASTGRRHHPPTHHRDGTLLIPGRRRSLGQATPRRARGHRRARQASTSPKGSTTSVVVRIPTAGNARCPPVGSRRRRVGETDSSGRLEHHRHRRPYGRPTRYPATSSMLDRHGRRSHVHRFSHRSQGRLTVWREVDSWSQLDGGTLRWRKRGCVAATVGP